MRDLLTRLRGGRPACTCEAAVDGRRLVVTADGCPGRADLAASPACRASTVRALTGRDAEVVVTRAEGTERRYARRGGALFVAAARFRERVAGRDERLAALSARDPLAAAREAAGRAGPVATAGAETGLTAVAEGIEGYDALRPFVGPTVARALVVPDPPDDGRLTETRTLSSDATVRVYATPDDAPDGYHLEPVEAALSDADRATLARARSHLVGGGAGDGPNAAERAVARVAASADARPETLARVLRKHTHGYGVLEDFFADEAVTDVFASAPAARTDLRLRADGRTLRTNVRLTDDGAAALASQLRRESGRAFSRADPTLDAVATDVGAAARVRAAGVTAPLSDGTGFAFRAHERTAWTLSRLVANGTIPADAAGLLSVAVERAAALLLAGPRGAGKTTLLGALLWELPATTRVVALEDTPELPVEALRAAGRDVQALVTDREEGRGVSPAGALRTALRLGDGALAVGEVRGEEAGVLYEAMRVGSGGDAVLGTIHGDGADAVRTRVVDDLGVSAESFAATDVVVTLTARATADGRRRRLASVEEVRGTAFDALYAEGEATGRVERGNSHLVASLAGPDETYRDVLDAVDEHARRLARLAESGRIDPTATTGGNQERSRTPGWERDA